MSTPSRKKRETWSVQLNSSQQYWAGQILDLSDLFILFKASNPQSVPSHYPAPQEDKPSLHIEMVDIFGMFVFVASDHHRY